MKEYKNMKFCYPKSRSSVGGFPHTRGEFVIEIIKENWRFEWESWNLTMIWSSWFVYVLVLERFTSLSGKH